MPGFVSMEAAQLWKKLRPDGEAAEADGRTEWAEEGREACKPGKELGLAVRGTEPLGPSCDHALPYPRAAVGSCWTRQRRGRPPGGHSAGVGEAVVAALQSPIHREEGQLVGNLRIQL